MIGRDVSRRNYVDFAVTRKYNVIRLYLEVKTLAKMGRPKVDDPRKNAVMVRFTDTEYEQLKERAAKYNLTVAETIRKEMRLRKS